MIQRGLRIVGLVGIGLAIGLGLGLYLGWDIWPTQYTNAVPEILQDSYKRDYAVMIAAAYAADQDLPSAQRRIRSFGQDGGDFLFSVTLDAILRGENEAEIRQLVRLAADLGYQSPALAPYLTGDTDAGTTIP